MIEILQQAVTWTDEETGITVTPSNPIVPRDANGDTIEGWTNPVAEVMGDGVCKFGDEIIGTIQWEYHEEDDSVNCNALSFGRFSNQGCLTRYEDFSTRLLLTQFSKVTAYTDSPGVMTQIARGGWKQDSENEEYWVLTAADKAEIDAQNSP